MFFILNVCTLSLNSLRLFNEFATSSHEWLEIVDATSFPLGLRISSSCLYLAGVNLGSEFSNKEHKFNTATLGTIVHAVLKIDC